MRVYSLITFISFCILSCSKKSDERNKTPITTEIKKTLIAELKQMKANDQLYRLYLSIGTSNQKLIDSVQSLPMIEQIKFKQSYKSEFTKAQKDSLWSLQNEIDLNNTNRVYKIIEKYGWLDKSQLDSVIDPTIFLFHTPKQTIEKMQILLYKEVQAKRMKPNKLAMYVDNMRKKAFGKHQLYGTGDEFDVKTNTIEPPFIENIDSTNMSIIKIGLPKLKKDEYRTSL